MAKRRPSGDGMVRKREDGRWEGRIVVGHKKNGTPIFQHAYAHTQKELTEKLHQNIERYQDVELTEDSRMTLASAGGVAGPLVDGIQGRYGAARYAQKLSLLYRILHQAAAGRQANLPHLSAGHPADVPPPENRGTHS